MLTNIVTYVIDSCGEIRIQKGFQKILYFLTEAGVPTRLTYTLYHYGPYSIELSHQIDNLECSGAIKLKEDNLEYIFKKGTNTQRLKKDAKGYESIIDDILERLPIDRPRELELLSTAHYVAKVQQSVYGVLDEDKIVQEVMKMKRGKFYGENNIRRAYNALHKQGLIYN